jgi:hypothetical protein
MRTAIEALWGSLPKLQLVKDINEGGLVTVDRPREFKHGLLAIISRYVAERTRFYFIGESRFG